LAIHPDYWVRLIHFCFAFGHLGFGL
jgi:hypothetical protein